MTTTNTQKSHLYFGARKTCLEMLRDRHYNVPDYLFGLTETQFNLNKDSYQKINDITDDKGVPVYIFMSESIEKSALFDGVGAFLKSCGIDFINVKGKTVNNEENIKSINGIRLIIIYNAKDASSSLVKLNETYIGDPNKDASFIEAFDVNMMYINPTKHIYQPKWRLMTESEILEVVQKYENNPTRITKNLFASVCIDDPINRYYGGQPPSKNGKSGDMYEIIRDGVNIFYRKVVSKRMNIGKH